jgi:hypothetical protein
MRYVSHCEAPFSHWMFYGNFDTINGSWAHISPLNKPLYGVNSYYWQDSGKVFLKLPVSSMTRLQIFIRQEHLCQPEER